MYEEDMMIKRYCRLFLLKAKENLRFHSSPPLIVLIRLIKSLISIRQLEWGYKYIKFRVELH